jgi:hypothetical protein
MSKIRKKSVRKSPLVKKESAGTPEYIDTPLNQGERNYGGLKKKKSSTDTRKNVNADPNLVQGNELEE